ncbi:MAG: DUF4861 family protein [Asticcacaulis sp.]|nr:DUF4861 family protein [Asticcacaulis sp.]
MHDGLIAFEGIGWESDRVAYRLYLDARNVPDLFGKFGTGMIFPEVGHGFDDYQYPRAWGGDIFKVGDSLGMGGTGLLRGGKASQIGAATVTGKVVANGPVTAIAEVDADAIGGGAASIHATYAISAGSPLTEVKIAAKSLTLPLVAGLTVHPGDRTFVSPSKAGSAWAYVAVWGPQEHGIDKVGTALFYRRDRVTGAPGFDGQTLFIQFLSKVAADYAFAGRWVQENKDVPGYDGTIKNEAAFTAWLEASATELDHPVIVKALP